MTISGSPATLLLFGLDESGATSTRKNSGSLGSAHDLLPETDTAKPGEGVPTISDGNNGRAAVIAPDPTSNPTLIDEWRRLIGKIETGNPSAHSAAPVLPLSDAANDFAYGVRFKPVAPYTEGVADEDMNVLWTFGKDAASVPFLGLSFKWQDDTDSSLGGRLYITTPEGGSPGYEVTDQGGTPVFGSVTGGPADWYILPDRWYRVLVRCFYNGASGMTFKVYVQDETAGTTYTFTYSDTADVNDWPVASADHAWMLGTHFDGTNAFTSAYAAVDEAWLYDAPLTDDEATAIVISGISIPWVEPSYNRDEHVVYSAVTKEDADYPQTRVLPTGGTIVRHPVDVLCQEVRCRLEGWKAGEPWALRALDFVFDPAGPYGSQRARKGERPDLTVGVWRTPGRKPWGACEDSRNVEFTYAGPRRRRGFKIRRDVDSSAPTGHNAFWTWRSYADELFRAYKVGTSLYLDDGGSAASLSTGWGANDMPSTFFLDDRFVILSNAKRVMLDGSTTVQELGAAAPASISAAAGAGGTLLGDYFYAATLYDPIKGDETGPVVTTAVVSPATQKVTLTLPAAAPEARYTEYRIYRTVDGGSAPTFFLIDTHAVGTNYDDTGEVDGVELLPQVNDSSSTFLGYITSALPDTFALGIAHKERAVYAKGGTNPERIYFFEANEPLRNYSAQWIAADGPVRALASWQGRIVVFTDNTVEIVESDFVRDADGNLNINRTVISRSVGALGQGSVITFQGQIFWLDRRGVFTLQGTEAVPVSQRIQDLFPYINTNKGTQIVGGWNHLTRSLWWTLPQSAFQTDNALMQTQFVMPLDEPEKWWFHDLEATFVGQFDDDLNGQRFGLMDAAGIFKELESYEGDGQEGDEAGTFEDEGTDDFATTPAGITSLTNLVIAVEGAPGWTTNEHRGKGVILRDRSNGLLTYHTIRSNTSAGFSVERTPSTALAAGDGYYIGGMNAFVQFAGHDFGSQNRKVVRQVQYTFAPLTKEDLYL